MAASARKKLIDPTVVGVYHCWNRCVRQEFLLGVDYKEDKDFGRREYVVGVEQRLAGLFAIEVGFHATMDNHLHLILRNRPDVVARWSDADVVRRWLIITRLKRNGILDVADPTAEEIQRELSKPDRIRILRKRLAHVSWFMGTLCENVSRHANAQDGKEGAFWQGRYRCQNLTDEASLLVCGVYVDLNVIRAGAAESLNESRFTSIYDRLRAKAAQQQSPAATAGHDTSADPALLADAWLSPLTLDETRPVGAAEHVSSHSSWRASDKGLLPITLEQYVALLTWTGQQVRADKRGSIPVPASISPVLEQLQIKAESWVDAIVNFKDWFGRALGSVQGLAKVTARSGRRWLHGQRHCASVFG
jgi:hypothetical protein